MRGPSMNEDQNVQLMEYTFIENYIEVMAMSLFVYDSIISFDLEWRTVWSRKVTGASALYITLRYVTFITMVLDVTNFSASYNVSLNYIGFQLLHPIFTGRMHCLRDIFGSGRVYAIDGHQWTKATVVMILGLVPVVLNIANVWAIESSLSTSKHDKYVLLATRTCVLMSNLLVVVSTWQATRTNRAANMRNSKGSLTTTLMRDGIVHFALVVGINIADITSALLTGELFDFSAPVEL
ncbi:hypothetical protein IEO21_06585 [Rhodonia placenta]|uniref:DUF6533 domain-containing protein n=1 Tax=Rhodonia placenta TaxID=104341 RepID=A0A8H7NZR1_9APHY|nr:hypothetical protein IEO21_06585 [Postia placenta]